MGLYFSENFKTLLLVVMILFQPNVESSLQHSSQLIVTGMLKLQIYFLKKMKFNIMVMRKFKMLLFVQL